MLPLFLGSYFEFQGGEGVAQFQKPTATLCRRYFTTDEAEALKDGIFVFQTNRLLNIIFLQ